MSPHLRLSPPPRGQLAVHLGLPRIEEALQTSSTGGHRGCTGVLARGYAERSRAFDCTLSVVITAAALPSAGAAVLDCLAAVTVALAADEEAEEEAEAAAARRMA